MEDKDEEHFEGDKLLFEEAGESTKKSSQPKKESQSKKEVKKSHKQEDHQEKHVERHEKMQENTPKRTKRESQVHIEKEEDGHTIKIKINRLFYERIIYWIIIIVLIVLIIKNPFGFGTDCTKAEITTNDPASNAGAIDNPAAETDNSPGETAPESTPEPEDDEPVLPGYGVQDGECIEVDLIGYEGKGYSTLARCQEALDDSDDDSSDSSNDNAGGSSCDDGDVEVEIISVNMNSDNSKKVESVEIRITNNDNKDLNGFYLNLKWYNNDDTSEGIANLPKLLEKGSTQQGEREYNTVLQKCGGTITYVLDDELATHYVTTREIQNTVKIEVLDLDEMDELGVDTAIINSE